MPRIKVQLVSWSDIVEWSSGLATVIKKDGYKPDVIVALARGGYVPARLLCDLLDVENLLSIQSQHWTEAAKAEEKAIIKFKYVIDLSGLKALIVDDIVDTGDSLKLARDYIREFWKPLEVKTAALQWISPVAKFKPDYYYMDVREWIWFQYPWTRLEDTYQFIKRMMHETYRESGKREWSYKEIVNGFREWFGIDVGSDYMERALEVLINKNVIKRDPVSGKYVLLVEG